MDKKEEPKKPETETKETETPVKDEKAEATEAQAQPQEAAEADEPLTHGEKKKLRKMEAELEAAKAEAAAAQDKYLRVLAEYDNYRRRTAKEKESIYTDAYGEAVTAILPIADNLERAAACKDTAGVAEGVALTLKSFGETLKKLGITEIEAQGKSFDPNFHNAVMHIEDENVGENTVVEVFQKGYCKDGKVIRFAMVKVAN